MSLIIGVVEKDRVIMMGDSMSSYGEDKIYIHDTNNSKVVVLGNFLVGASGNVSTIQLAERVIRGYQGKRLNKRLIVDHIIPDINYLLKNELNLDKDGINEQEYTIMLAEGNRLYVFSRGYCLRAPKVMSVGSGEDFIGAYIHELYNSKKPIPLMREALGYATSLSRSVGGSILHLANSKDLRVEVMNNDSCVKM